MRRAKSDGLDARKLLSMLVRYHAGERKVWSVVRVPTVEEEDRRQLHRELRTVRLCRRGFGGVCSGSGSTRSSCTGRSWSWSVSGGRRSWKDGARRSLGVPPGLTTGRALEGATSPRACRVRLRANTGSGDRPGVAGTDRRSFVASGPNVNGRLPANRRSDSIYDEKSELDSGAFIEGFGVTVIL